MSKFDFLKEYSAEQIYNYLKNFLLNKTINSSSIEELASNASEIIDVCYDINKKQIPSLLALLTKETRNSPQILSRIENLITNKDLMVTKELIYSLKDIDRAILNSFALTGLNKHYKKTLEEISQIYEVFKKDDLIDILNRSSRDNFVFDNDNKNLTLIDSKLLNNSLKNNPIKTLKLYNDAINHKDNLGDAIKVSNKYIDAIKNTDFTLSYSTLNLSRVNSEFIDISLKNDVNKTFRLLVENPNSLVINYLTEDDFFDFIDKSKDFYLTNDTYNQYKEICNNQDMVDELLNISLNNNFMETISLEGVNLSMSESFILKKLLDRNNKLPINKVAQTYIGDFLSCKLENIDYLFNKDSFRALDIILHIDLENQSSEFIDKVVNNLDKMHYYLNYEYGNSFLDKRMFYFSLKNNYKKTMDYLVVDSRIPDFISYQVKTYGDKIYKLLSEKISENTITYSKLNYVFFNLEPKILINALKLNYDNAIESFPKKWNKNQDISIENENDSKELIDTLKANNFVISLDNYYLLYNSIDFLIASLENDYMTTKTVLSTLKEFTNYSINGYEYNRLVSVLEKHDDIETFNKIKSLNISLLKDLMNEDYKLGFKLLNENKPVESYFSRKDAFEIVNSLANKDFSFLECPTLAGLMSYPLLSNPTQDLNLLVFLTAHGFPESLLNFQTYEDISLFLKSDLEKELYFKIWSKNENYVYSKKDEEKLLKLLGNNSNSIEEEIVRLHKENKKRIDLDLTEMLVIILYAKKVLHQKGNDNIKVDVFAYSDVSNSLGVYNSGKGVVSLCNGHNQSIYAMIETLHHEINHTIQNKDSMELNVNHDPDIIVYAKDKILNNVLAYTKQYPYYINNYWRMAFEYDTEFKSQMEAINLLEPKKGYISSEDRKSMELFEYGRDNNKYSCESLRIYDNREYYLDELFDKVVSLAYKDGLIDVFSIYTSNPIVEYEYTFRNGNLIKKSNKELFKAYSEAKNEKEKDIYLAIINFRLDSRYVRNAIDNIDEFLKFNSDDKLLKLIEKKEEEYLAILKYNKKDTLLHLDKYFKFTKECLENSMYNIENKKR